MIRSNNGYGKLKEVIVGRELKLKRRLSDLTFKQFYREAITEKVYQTLKSDNDIYYVNQDLIDLRNKQLDAMAETLEGLGIVVRRPEEVTSIKVFKTPNFSSELSSASNVRDLTLIYKDKIIETPTYVHNRYFENQSLYEIFNNAYRDGGQWIRCPHTKLTDDRIDFSEWNTNRDYDNFDEGKYDMAIDGAQFLRLDNDCIVGINSYNHYLGFKWVKSFFPEVNFHTINITDNHIDGAIVALRSGVFLVNPKYPNIIEDMPEKFKSWKYIYPERHLEEKDLDVTGMTSADIQLASSRGMDINVLSIDENTVMINKAAKSVKKALVENGFKVIEVELENGEIFAGGIHCSTLDIVRE